MVFQVEQGTAQLAAVLQGMHWLTLSRHVGCALMLAFALQSLTQLQHLHIVSSRLEESAVAPALSAMTGLQTLGVSNNFLLEISGAEALRRLLGAAPGLTHLDVSGNGLGEEGVARLALLLRGMTCLLTLNLKNTSIDDQPIPQGVDHACSSPCSAAPPSYTQSEWQSFGRSSIVCTAACAGQGRQPPAQAGPQLEPCTIDSRTCFGCRAVRINAAAEAPPATHRFRGRGLGNTGPCSQPPSSFAAVAGAGP